MRLSIVLLIALFAIVSISQTGQAKTHTAHRIAAVAGAGAATHKVATVAGAATHLLKPKLVAGAALAGGALAGKALIAKKVVAGALLGKALLLKPKLIVGGLVAGKLVKKALVVGAGALVAKKLIRSLRQRKPCRRCRNCVRRRAVVSRSVETQKAVVSRSVDTQKAVSHRIQKRSIFDVVNRGLESVSDRVRGAGNGLQVVGDTLNPLVSQGVGLLRNVSTSAVDGIRRGASELGLVRNKRATSEDAKVRQLLEYVRVRKGQSCLQRVICELSVYNYHYGEEGISFGTKLLTYQHTNINDPQVALYKQAQAQGLAFRSRNLSPKACRPKYPCQYDTKAVIADGNRRLYSN